MTTTFTWPVQAKPTGTMKLRVLTSQFGDGYEQVAGDGINNKEQSWPVSIKGLAAQVVPARDFLDARQGYQSFFWTPPLGASGYYRCNEYSLQHVGGFVYELTATFKQAFQP
jgi:phage-related protein